MSGIKVAPFCHRFMHFIANYKQCYLCEMAGSRVKSWFVEIVQWFLFVVPMQKEDLFSWRQDTLMIQVEKGFFLTACGFAVSDWVKLNMCAIVFFFGGTL